MGKELICQGKIGIWQTGLIITKFPAKIFNTILAATTAPGHHQYCGKNSKLHSHHEDYSKSLDVM